jgi:hypothetical protein
MRMNLKVPFAEKDEAKKLGARWDPTRKIWYVESDGDMARFSRWAPSAHEGGAELPAKSAPAKKLEAASKLIVGSNYSAQVRVCECLPWRVCSKCESTSLSH